MAQEASRWQGERFVLILYAILVGLAGLFGYIIGLARPKNLDPRLFMIIDLPPNAFGMALYGAVTIGSILGVLLLGVRYVAREYDTVENRG
jgi:ABC-type antimicrobial peptide transport system permease subunit